MCGAVRRGAEAFARALDVIWSDDSDDEQCARAYEDMGGALDAALAGDGTAVCALREVVRVLHRAAQLTETEANPHREQDGYVGSARELSVDLLKNGQMHAALMLSYHGDEGAALRLHTLGLTAWVNSGAAGLLAGDLPDLVGPTRARNPRHAAGRFNGWPTPGTSSTDSAQKRARLAPLVTATGR